LATNTSSSFDGGQHVSSRRPAPAPPGYQPRRRRRRQRDRGKRGQRRRRGRNGTRGVWWRPGRPSPPRTARGPGRRGHLHWPARSSALAGTAMRSRGGRVPRGGWPMVADCVGVTIPGRCFSLEPCGRERMRKVRTHAAQRGYAAASTASAAPSRGARRRGHRHPGLPRGEPSASRRTSLAHGATPAARCRISQTLCAAGSGTRLHEGLVVAATRHTSDLRPQSPRRARRMTGSRHYRVAASRTPAAQTCSSSGSTRTPARPRKPSAMPKASATAPRRPPTRR
jgi:hypothetical protein